MKHIKADGNWLSPEEVVISSDSSGQRVAKCKEKGLARYCRSIGKNV